MQLDQTQPSVGPETPEEGAKLRRKRSGLRGKAARSTESSFSSGTQGERAHIDLVLWPSHEALIESHSG